MNGIVDNFVYNHFFNLKIRKIANVKTSISPIANG